DKAKSIGKKFFHAKKSEPITLVKSGEGSEVPIYSLSYSNGKAHGYLDLSEKGGHPITLLIDREISPQKLSLNDGLIEAEKYIKTMGYEGMTLFQSQQFDNIGVFTFLYQDGDVRVYADTMEIKV